MGETEADRGSDWGSTRPGSIILFVEPRALIRECLGARFQDVISPDVFIGVEKLQDWGGFAQKYEDPDLVRVSSAADTKAIIEFPWQGRGSAGLDAVPRMVVIADGEDPRHVLDALDGGAQGFISTSLPIAIAIEALRLVVAGGTYVPSGTLLAARFEKRDFDALRFPSQLPLFTERQFAVIEMLRQGKANKVIAHELNMRESTVKVHIRNIMRKLSASNRTQVAYLYQSMMLDGI